MGRKVRRRRRVRTKSAQCDWGKAVLPPGFGFRVRRPEPMSSKRTPVGDLGTFQEGTGERVVVQPQLPQSGISTKRLYRRSTS